MRRHAHPGPRQDGATTAEYLTVLLLVAAVVGTLSATGLADPMVGAIRAAFCRVNLDGGSCAAGGAGSPIATAPPPSCTISSTSDAVDGSVTIASVDVGGDVGISLTERTIDGETVYDVGLDFSGRLGAKLQEGGKVTVGEDGFLRGGREWSVAAGGELAVTPTYRFDDREDAEALVAQTRDLVEGPIDDTFDWQTLVPVWGPGRVAKNQYDRLRDYDPGMADIIRVEGSTFVEGSVSAFEGGTAAEASGELARGIGMEINTQTGEKSLYFVLTGEVAASLGLQVVGGSGGVEGEAIAKVTVDGDWDLQDLELGTTITGAAGADTIAAEALWFAEGTSLPADVGDAIGGIGLEGSDEQTWTLDAAGTIDLTDPALRDAAQQFWDGIEGGDLSGTVAAGQLLGDHVVDDSDILVQYRSGDRSRNGIDVQAGGGWAFGIGGGVAGSNEALQDAWYRPGGGTWLSGACGP